MNLLIYTFYLFTFYLSYMYVSFTAQNTLYLIFRIKNLIKK